ncbi:hypothetical protein ACWGI8_28865 [Streptomyces sp. NPDC054841]
MTLPESIRKFPAGAGRMAAREITGAWSRSGRSAPGRAKYAESS